MKRKTAAPFASQSSVLSPQSYSADVHPNPPPEYRRTKQAEACSGGVNLTRSPRSTGSVLKPFIYAAAFDAGICSPKTMLLDSPAAWPGYQPSNYDRAFRGPMPAGDALAESRNIPALVLLGQVGVERAVGVMDSFGLGTIGRSKQAYGLTLAIGGAEATPLEIAEAYATLGVEEGVARARRIERGTAGDASGAVLAGARRDQCAGADLADLGAGGEPARGVENRDEQRAPRCVVRGGHAAEDGRRMGRQSEGGSFGGAGRGGGGGAIGAAVDREFGFGRGALAGSG
jgi:hypothetical protein